MLSCGPHILLLLLLPSEHYGLEIHGVLPEDDKHEEAEEETQVGHQPAEGPQILLHACRIWRGSIVKLDSKPHEVVDDGEEEA